jgi:hypothetical protein
LVPPAVTSLVVSPRLTTRIGGILGVALVGARIWLGALLWSPVYSALTWDDFTRVAIARRWAEFPFVSADLVWLPSQTWLLGSLFWLTGDTFAARPMALVAILNTSLIVLTAVVVGRSAFRLAGSTAGGWIAFVVVLFSPWGFYTSLAGLGEPIYYLGTSLAIAALIRFATRPSPTTPWWGAAAVALAAATRYEGWWLAVAWMAGMFWVIRRDRAGERLMQKPAARIRRIIPLLAPFLVPAGWMAYNLAETGNPLEFARRSAEYFSSAYGGPPTIIGRILYYPSALVRADLLLLLIVLGLAALYRRHPVVRLLVSVIVLHGALFLATSLVGSAVGAFNERFMFAFILAATPLVGFAPAALQRIPRPGRGVVVALATVLVIAVTAIRIPDRPTEWSHAPDLLALADAIDRMATEGDPLHISISPEMAAIEATPLTVVAGDRAHITVQPAMSPDADMRIERFPEPGLLPPTALGRYGVTGPLAPELPRDQTICHCDGWVYTDETGAELDLGDTNLAWTEFAGLDPRPGETTRTATTLAGGLGRASVEVRSLYGHGFNPGRMRVEVVMAGTVVESWDISEPSRWRRIEIDVPPDGAMLEVRVVAQPSIEFGWAWGTASTTLVRPVEDLPG